MNKRTSRTTLLDMALLFFATAILILPLFRIDYLDNWMSIEGSFISDARFVRDHWPHPAWNALWYCGNRFDYAYTPGTRYGAAIAAMLFHVIPARGYHIYIAFMYCLGTAGVYFLARIGTGSRAAAWFAACAETVLSPIFLILKTYRQDSMRWMPQRLNTLIKWGEGPHMCAMAMIPFALAFSLLAFRKGKPWTVAAAAICCALVVTDNLYGAYALGIFFPVLIWSEYVSAPGSGGWKRAIVIVMLSAGLCAWWLTPSFLKLTARNLMLVALPGNHWSELYGALIAMAFMAVSWWAGRVRKVSVWRVFVAGSLLFFAVDVLGQAWFDFRITGEPKRFVPELDILLILAATEVIRSLWIFKRWAAIAVTTLCFAFSVNYLARPWSVYSADPDYCRRVEYRMTEWIAQNFPGSRAMAFGSISYWYTTWRDLPEVTGGADQGAQTLLPSLARYQIRIEGDPERDVYFLQALGADAIVLNDANSSEIYHEVLSPRKFTGLLPIVYDQQGDIVYRVPRRPGLARVVDERRISKLKPIPWYYTDKAELRAYAETVEAIDTPAKYTRPALGEIRISAATQPGQSVLVQENYDPGWKAFVDGKGVRIETDIMGFMRVRPAAGAHEVLFAYGMPLESRIGMWISVLSLLLLAALVAVSWRETDSRFVRR